MKFESRLLGRSTKITLPPDPDHPSAPPDETLFLEYTIDCQICGTHTVLLAGHHLRALRNLLIETIDRDPGLCGEESGIEVVQRLQFGGTPPSDPNVN